MSTQCAQSQECPGIHDNLVSFRTSQQINLRGSLLHITRHVVTFELYTPECVLRTSEVLTEFKIVCGDQLLYSGQALVRSLVHTGLVAVVEANLDEGWIDINFPISPHTAVKLGGLFEEFVRGWQKLYRVRQEYKVAVSDLHTFLTDLRLWLEQIELGIRSSPSGDRPELEQQVLDELGHFVMPAINDLFGRFEVVTQTIEPELQPVHRAFGKRLLHPLLLSSPFVYRTFHKPLGYAGDYEVVNMMFRKPYEGPSVFGKVINAYALQLPPIVAHRNRIEWLTGRLVDEYMRAARERRVARFFSLGCGPAMEVQRFLSKDGPYERAEFVLADFNEETLEHAQRVLNGLKRHYGRTTVIRVIKQSVQQFLRQADVSGGRRAEDRFDMVYCAGLFDYLSDKVCRRLMEIFYDMLHSGGLLVATNVDDLSTRGEMEHFLDWHLMHRSTARMITLAPACVPPDEVSVARDTTGVNLLMSIRQTRT